MELKWEIVFGTFPRATFHFRFGLLRRCRLQWGRALRLQWFRARKVPRGTGKVADVGSCHLGKEQGVVGAWGNALGKYVTSHNYLLLTDQPDFL